MYTILFSLSIQMYLQAQLKNKLIAWISVFQFILHVPLSWLFVTYFSWGGSWCDECIIYIILVSSDWGIYIHLWWLVSSFMERIFQSCLLGYSPCSQALIVIWLDGLVSVWFLSFFKFSYVRSCFDIIFIQYSSDKFVYKAEYTHI